MGDQVHHLGLLRAGGFGARLGGFGTGGLGVPGGCQQPRQPAELLSSALSPQHHRVMVLHDGSGCILQAKVGETSSTGKEILGHRKEKSWPMKEKSWP